MGKTIESLETRLHEREQVVAELTQRLEQAAEQLERLQRTQGTVSPKRSETDGESDVQLLQIATSAIHADVRQILEFWDVAQPQAKLQRIEDSITELQLAVQTQSIAAPPPSTTYVSESDVSEMPHLSHSDATDPAPSDALATWEQIKAQLFDDTPLPSEPHQEEPAHIAASATPSVLLVGDQEIIEAPEAIASNCCDVEALQEAISQRDRYIAVLIRRLRNVEVPSEIPDADKLPSEVAGQHSLDVGRLHQMLNDHLRLAEVELAMERARLSREAIRLKALNQSLSLQMPTLTESTSEVSTDEAAPTTGRWLRFLRSETNARASNSDDAS